MARLIWTEPALNDLDAIAEYIALDKPEAARRLVQRVVLAAERLIRFPHSGSRPPEVSGLPYRQIVVPPCRDIYRVEKDLVFIVHVLRGEQVLRVDVLEERGLPPGGGG